MPLQGLEPNTNTDLLKKVCQGQLSLTEMKDAAESIKKKKKLFKLFRSIQGRIAGNLYKRGFPRLPPKKSWHSLGMNP